MYPEQNSQEAMFLKKHFASFYSKNKITSVPEVNHREFGFGLFKKKIANRNMSFSSEGEMNSFLREASPLFFSYSNAYYNFPARTPTIAKGLIGADIIYEFDADELGLEVEEINGVQWFMSNHLEEAKKQVFRLVDFIENDFGFPASELKINFSGKAGYHVHLRADNIKHLNKQARIELVDYLTGHNLDFEKLGFDFAKHYAPLQKNSKGLWQRRLMSGMKTYFENDSKLIAKTCGAPQKKLALLTADKKKLFDSFDKGLLLRLDGKKSSDFWKNVLFEVLKVQRSPIDRQTSIDLSKIIRVPETLHGDTGMIAKTIPLEKLKDFNPFVDAVVFDEKFSGERVKVHITKTPKFTLLGKEFGPFEETDEVLPLYCAIFLIGKGSAVLKQ